MCISTSQIGFVIEQKNFLTGKILLTSKQNLNPAHYCKNLKYSKLIIVSAVFSRMLIVTDLRCCGHSHFIMLVHGDVSNVETPRAFEPLKCTSSSLSLAQGGNCPSAAFWVLERGGRVPSAERREGWHLSTAGSPRASPVCRAVEGPAPLPGAEGSGPGRARLHFRSSRRSPRSSALAEDGGCPPTWALSKNGGPPPSLAARPGAG